MIRPGIRELRVIARLERLSVYIGMFDVEGIEQRRENVGDMNLFVGSPVQELLAGENSRIWMSISYS